VCSAGVPKSCEVEFDPAAVDGDDDPGGVSAGGGQVVIQGGQQHVLAAFEPGYGGMTDPELPGDFGLGELGGFADMARFMA
jgi:hypothetical protein